MPGTELYDLFLSYVAEMALANPAFKRVGVAGATKFVGEDGHDDHRLVVTAIRTDRTESFADALRAAADNWEAAHGDRPGAGGL